MWMYHIAADGSEPGDSEVFDGHHDSGGRFAPLLVAGFRARSSHRHVLVTTMAL